MLIVTLFTIAKIWKQPKCPPIGEWIKKTWHIYIYIHSGKLFRHEKGQNPAIFNNSDGT